MARYRLGNENMACKYWKKTKKKYAGCVKEKKKQ